MPVLAINGINAGALMFASEEPKSDRRDVGDSAQGADGSLRITRQTRKRDLKFRSVPLSSSDAHAWESLIIGEGEAWSFNTSLYGSKGLGPSASSGATIVASTPKFGAAKLNLAATGTITYSYPAINMYGGGTVVWTICVWRSTDDGATWTHYTVRGTSTAAAAKWVDGVRNDAASTTWLSVSAAGAVTIANADGTAVQYDDLVVLPFHVLDTWPPLIVAGNLPFSPLPYLELSGDMVTEQPRRTVLGTATESHVKVASGFRSKLEVEFKAK